MIITDTHTHLYSTQFDEDRNEMVQRALDAGVSRFFLPAIDSESHEAMFDLAAKYPENMFMMMGVHPTSVKDNYLEELKEAQNHLDSKKFYAIGEIGIDLYWDKTYLKQQQEAFRTQIHWAKERKLPIIIHCRDAFDEIFEILEEEKGEDLFGIFHCFSGNIKKKKKAVSYNMKLGIGGVVTFKNGKIDKFLGEIPIEEIVLETDAPYLAPSPKRGQRNESSFLTLILDKLVDIYGLSPEELAEITTKNSKDVFGI